MNKIVYVLLVAFVLTSCQKEKIGFIDNGIVINDFQEKKDLETKFQEKEEALKKRADSIGKAFQNEYLSVQTKAQNLFQRNKRKEAEQLMAPFQQKAQQLEQQIQIEQQQFQKDFQIEIDSLIVKVKDFVKDYGKKNGYTYILGTSDAAATVLYGTDENDLTKTILDALNETYKK
ncbi:OmpH family outer membrane protein [Flavivirga jejuensis]|uniref:OmpH family outer membrane protein n=1 Tax=Flavivirga jejuensis TaxID=870487 RepID=A0ABT8WR77_9FLAO|nr:OmpH family outer membrane protein [Flavivirga jejuensis]MDO5975417.1 OmpH family outer membrane protein [Flavivirga jejuensis]